MPASRSAPSAASLARSEVATPGSAICRSRMPVRCRIHSLVVLTSFSKCSLVSTLGGTYVERPAIFTGRSAGCGLGIFVSDYEKCNRPPEHIALVKQLDRTLEHNDVSLFFFSHFHSMQIKSARLE